jgi:hypothetical protein
VQLVGEAVELLAPHIVAGFESFAEAAACDIVGAQESFFRAAGANALAHRAAASRRAAGCYSGSPPPLNVSDEQLPFRGGQCEGARYRVSLTHKLQGEAEKNSLRSVFGPIDSIDLELLNTGNNREGVIIRARDLHGNINIVQVDSGGDNQRYDYLEINFIVRSDGGVDNCGDLPGFGPQYPPPVEPRPTPTAGSPVFPGGSLNVPVDFGGVTVPVGFIYSPAIINANGNVNLNFGGVDVNISPDLGVDFADDGSPGGEFGSDPSEFPGFPEIPDYSGDLGALGDAVAAVGAGQSALSDSVQSVSEGVGVTIDRIQEVKELLAVDFDDTLQWISCREEEEFEPYQGVGLRGIESALRAALTLMNRGAGEYCELLPQEPLAGDVIRTLSLSAQEIDNFFDVDIGVDARAISLEIDLVRNSYSVRRGTSGGNGNLQGRYGVVTFLEEVSVGNWHSCSESVSQYYSLGLYRVPKNGNAVRIRVSVSAGSSCIYKEIM